MGKPKKGKKGRQDDDFGDDDVEVDPLAVATEAEPSEPAKGAGKKGKKGRRKKDDDWEDDVANDIATLSLDGEAPPSGNVANGEDPQPGSKKKRKNKKKVSFDESGSEEDDADPPSPTPVAAPKAKKGGMSAFQMLAMEDDDDEEDQKSSDESPSPTPTPVAEEMPQPVAGKGKKGKQKGKQKGKNAEEEDIDALLAAIDAPEEKKGKKKKKKAAEEEPSEEATPAAEPMEETPAVDVTNLTQDQIAAMLEAQYDEEEGEKKKKKKKAKKEAAAAEPAVQDAGEEAEVEEEGEVDPEGTVKTAAQKKKEKKERQRLQKLAEKEKGKKKAAAPAEPAADAPNEAAPEESAPAVAGPAVEGGSDEEAEESDKKKKKKDKKKKKKGEEEEEKEKKKKPVNKQVRAMQEALAKLREEEERMEREEEEREKAMEAARIAKEEKDRLEKEKKEKDKLKKKEKMDRLKAEGKYLTAKQKEAKRRAEQMLEAMKAQGVALPQVEETDKPKKRVVYDNKKKKKVPGDQLKSPTTPTSPTSPTMELEQPPLPSPLPEAKEEKAPAADVAESWEDIKDEWDASSDEEDKQNEAQETQPETKAPAQVQVKADVKKVDVKKADVKKADVKKADVEEEEEESEEDSEDEESDEDSDDDEDSETESSSEEEEEKLTPAEKLERVKEKARERLQKAHVDAEAKRTTDTLRAPVVVVLGHVDTGKTKILDKLRRTNVQDGEAGGITQQIGATNVPDYTIREQTKMCKEFIKKELKIPGLLIIDTPGHESFSNLRNRGSSLCDIAILVIDIMHGLEPQTIESINLLKKRKTPFVVALNKVDRLFGWLTNPHADIQNTLKKQKPNTKIEFDERVAQVVVQLAEQGLNACLSYENKNPREYISLVPTSAHSGDGMGSLIALICDLTQTMLAKRLMWSEELQAITMEVKAIAGLGTTIDVILVNGCLKEGQTIVLGGTDGPIVTQIRGLLMPQPLKELRVKNAYTHHKEVMAAQGVKIIAKDLEKALAGLPLYVGHGLDEIEVYKEDVEEALGAILGSIKVQERGVFVQASTLGSLEALLEFLRTSKIPYAGINIGPLHRRDVMKASIMLEHDVQYAAILAFDVKVEREAQEMADNLGVRIFTADIIYHLFDQFMAHRAEYKRQKQEEFKHIAVFPCKLRILPQYVFNSRDPIVAGVVVEAGFLKEGMPLCVPSKQFVEIGRVTSIENNHKQVDIAKKGQEVCIKIEPIPGDAPKMFGRHFDETDIVTTKISRQSIDAVKDHFREEMSKADWQLMVDLKKIFQIL